MCGFSGAWIGATHLHSHEECDREGVCQTLSVTDQLRMGLRHIEIDITSGYGEFMQRPSMWSSYSLDDAGLQVAIDGLQVRKAALPNGFIHFGVGVVCLLMGQHRKRDNMETNPEIDQPLQTHEEPYFRQPPPQHH